jgi:YidC/Oxa1 family membrane protein insertase
MNIFSQLYNTIVFRPLLNLLQILFDLTGDIGWSIVILSVAVNVLMWPLFIKTYLNGQKLKYLSPQLKALQEKYKDNREQLLQEQIKFNRKHGISNGSFLLIIILQILVASGLYLLIRKVSDGTEIKGLYPIFFENSKPNFDTLAFGIHNISAKGKDIIIYPILGSIFTFMYGYYTNYLAPKPPALPKPIKKIQGDDSTKASLVDPEELQKMIGVQMVFFLPIMLFVFNYSFVIGVNIYLVIVNMLSLVRQIFVTQYYKNHVQKFFDDLAQTDPNFDDNHEMTTDIVSANTATISKIIDVKSKIKKKNKNTKKKSKFNRK